MANGSLTSSLKNCNGGLVVGAWPSPVVGDDDVIVIGDLAMGQQWRVAPEKAAELGVGLIRAYGELALYRREATGQDLEVEQSGRAVLISRASGIFTEVSDQEIELVDHYRKLTPEGRKMALRVVGTLAGQYSVGEDWKNRSSVNDRRSPDLRQEKRGGG